MKYYGIAKECHGMNIILDVRFDNAPDAIAEARKQFKRTRQVVVTLWDSETKLGQTIFVKMRVGRKVVELGK